MTIQTALLRAITTLRSTSTSAQLDAEVLLSSVMRQPKTWLLAHHDHAMTTVQTVKFRSLVTQRKNGMPIAYLTGHREFYGLDFSVNKHVLVPRPETETLVEETIRAARQLEKRSATAKPRIADIGTGSGCIAITLAKYLPRALIFASDVSMPALTVARRNAARHRLSSRITFVRGNLFTPFQSIVKRKPIDIIVANLPYLRKPELAGVKHEPRIALYGGKMGIEVIDRLLARARHYLAPHGALLLEIASDQAGSISYAAQRQFPEKNVRTIQDLAGRDRVVIIE